MYKTQKNPEWQFGRQGITIDRADAAAIAKTIARYAELDEDKFTELKLGGDKDEKEEKPKVKAKPARTSTKNTKNKTGAKAGTNKGRKAPWEDE